ncbi:hypothetical protein CEF21_15725 [Bacillus sp. FJAT-42376]|nr:hypothetical protein CEF21_15725 [Bacillus sp. FJAT-42376]
MSLFTDKSPFMPGMIQHMLVPFKTCRINIYLALQERMWCSPVVRFKILVPFPFRMFWQPAFSLTGDEPSSDGQPLIRLNLPLKPTDFH